MSTCPAGDSDYDGVGWIHRDYVAVMFAVGCFVSLIVGVLVCLTYYRVPALRQQPNNLIISRTVCDTVTCLSVCFFLGLQHFGESQKCRQDFCNNTVGGKFFAVCIQVGLLCSELFYCCMTLHLWHGNHPFVNFRKNNKVYYSCVLSISVLSAIVLLLGPGVGTYSTIHISDPSGHFVSLCWLENDPHRSANYWSWILLYISMGCIYLFGMAISVYCWWLWSGGLPRTSSTRENAIRRSQRCVGGYTFYAFLEVATTVPAFNNPLTASYTVLWLMVISSRGIADCMVWLVSMYWPRDRTFKDMVYDAFGFDGVLFPNYEAFKYARDQAYETDQDAMADASLNMILQEELINVVSKGIILDAKGLSASGLSSEGHSLRRSRSSESPGSLDSILGMDYTEGRSSRSVPLLERPSEDSAKISDQMDGTQLDGEAIGESEPLEFARFADLRHHFGVTADILEKAFTFVEPRHSNENHSEWLIQASKASFTPAKSGAFMFFSSCRRFIVKTVERSEWEFFCKNGGQYLKSYVDYMTHEANQQTHLPRFYGFYKLKFKQYQHQMYCCFMENVFPDSVRTPCLKEVVNPTIDDMFDLKGSWVDRNAPHRERPEIPKPQKWKDDRSTVLEVQDSKKEASKRCKYCHRKMNAQDNPQFPKCDSWRSRTFCEAPCLMKDNDLNYKVLLPETQLRSIRSQLDKDVRFLESQNVMDYSLLLGVTHNDLHQTGGVVAYEGCGTSGSAATGGFVVAPAVVQAPRFFFFGLIDVLQEWNAWKLLEQYIKTYLFWHERDGLSCVEPVYYRRRFVEEVIDGHFTAVPPTDASDEMLGKELQEGRVRLWASHAELDRLRSGNPTALGRPERQPERQPENHELLI